MVVTVVSVSMSFIIGNVLSWRALAIIGESFVFESNFKFQQFESNFVSLTSS